MDDLLFFICCRFSSVLKREIPSLCAFITCPSVSASLSSNKGKDIFSLLSLFLFNRWLHDVHKLSYYHITFANKGIENLPSNFPSTYILKFTQHLNFRNELFSGTESEWTQSVNLCVWFSVCRAALTCWWTPVSGRNGWWMAYWWLPWTNTEKSAPSSPVVELCS